MRGVGQSVPVKLYSYVFVLRFLDKEKKRAKSKISSEIFAMFLLSYLAILSPHNHSDDLFYGGLCHNSIISSAIGSS